MFLYVLLFMLKFNTILYLKKKLMMTTNKELLDKENVFLKRILIIYIFVNFIGLMINPIWLRTLYALMLLPFLAMLIISKGYVKKFETQLANAKDEIEKNKIHKSQAVKISMIIISSILFLNPLFYFYSYSTIGDILVANKQYKTAKSYHDFAVSFFKIPFLFAEKSKKRFYRKKIGLYFSHKQDEIYSEFIQKLVDLDKQGVK